MPNDPQNAPIYKVGDTIYLLISAKRGELERFRVDNVSWHPTLREWTYIINIRKAGGPGRPPWHVAPDSHASTTNYFAESEIVDFCGAVSTARAYFQAKLDSLAALEETYEC